MVEMHGTVIFAPNSWQKSVDLQHCSQPSVYILAGQVKENNSDVHVSATQLGRNMSSLQSFQVEGLTLPQMCDFAQKAKYRFFSLGKLFLPN